MVTDKFIIDINICFYISNRKQDYMSNIVENYKTHLLLILSKMNKLYNFVFLCV